VKVRDYTLRTGVSASVTYHCTGGALAFDFALPAIEAGGLLACHYYDLSRRVTYYMLEVDKNYVMLKADGI
jgi:hypothetical protein